MNLKKIMALAMLVLVALPSLTTVMGQQTFTIDGYKYEDKNRNEEYDDGEPGVEGVTITLTGKDADDNTVNIVLSTGEDGYFIFDDVKPGTYEVTETVPEGWAASTETSYELLDFNEDVSLGFGNYVETETDLKCSIEIASLYLEDIKGIVDALWLEYENTDHEPVLKSVKDILGYDEEVEGAEDFLEQASEAYEAGEYNKAARSLAAARNILGRVNGMLTSVYKAHKVARTERFIRQVEHRIEGLEDKIERLRGRLGTVKANNAMASMNRAKVKLGQLGVDLSEGNNDEVIDGIVVATAGINAALKDFGGDDSEILEAIDRLEAKILVLKASSEKLAKKGSDTSAVDDLLDRAEILLNNAMESLVENDMEEAETFLEQAEDIVSDAGNNLRTIRHPNKDKGNKDSKPGKKSK